MASKQRSLLGLDQWARGSAFAVSTWKFQAKLAEHLKILSQTVNLDRVAQKEASQKGSKSRMDQGR